MTRTTAIRLTALLAFVLAPVSLDAYLQLTVSARNGVELVRWSRTPVRWFASNQGTTGVSASDFQATMSRAFATWEAVPTASVAFQFAGFTGAPPSEDDDLSVFGFEHAPELDRVLGATTFVVDVITGDIVESDVFFNTIFSWSTSASGDSRFFDLQSVATHEIGHFVGLGHSALGETEVQANGRRRVIATGAVMFPISFGAGNTADRTLQPDDIAGVSDLYPDGDFRATTGVAQGKILIGGRGVSGAHVIAFNPSSGELIAGFALGSGGEFQIAGLTPGAHVIRVEPLDDADIDSFFDPRDIEIDFRVTVHDRLLPVPVGGASAPLDVTVPPK